MSLSSKSSSRPTARKKLNYISAFEDALNIQSRHLGDRNNAARNGEGVVNNKVADEFFTYFPKGHRISKKRLNQLENGKKLQEELEDNRSEKEFRKNLAEQDRIHREHLKQQQTENFAFKDYKFKDIEISPHSPTRSDSSSSNRDLSQLPISFATNRPKRNILAAKNFADTRNYTEHSGGYAKLTKMGLLARIMNIKKKAAKPAKPTARKTVKPKPAVRKVKPAAKRVVKRKVKPVVKPAVKRVVKPAVKRAVKRVVRRA
jgi:hypothetical protein